MFPLYVFSLVVGGGFLAFSVLGDLLGGDVSDVDTDLDLHMDADLHLDTDVHLDSDVHLDADLDAHAGDADGGSAASKVLSLRTVVYTLFGFGGVGTLLSMLWQGGAPVTTAAFSAVGGLSPGALIHSVFAYIRGSESGQRQHESSFEGLLGRVVLPLAEGSWGEIVVARGTREFRLKAQPHSSMEGDASAADWKRVIVVEMKNGIALVAPGEGELLLESPDVPDS